MYKSHDDIIKQNNQNTKQTGCNINLHCHHPIFTLTLNLEESLQGYKTLFMLNSTEHEVNPVNKCNNDNNFKMPIQLLGYFNIYMKFKFHAHLS